MENDIKRYDDSYKRNGSIEDNYKEKIGRQVPYMRGFDFAFLPKEVIKTIIVNVSGHPIKVDYIKAYFGDGKYTTDALVTERVDIDKSRVFGGIGTDIYGNANIMRAAIMEACREMNVMICDEICSWPFCKVIIQDNLFKN